MQHRLSADAVTDRDVLDQLIYGQDRGTFPLALVRGPPQQMSHLAGRTRSAWSRAIKSISYADQCKSLTVLRRDLPEWADAANCSSQQMTLRRLDKAFGAFFRRAKVAHWPTTGAWSGSCRASRKRAIW